MNRLTIKDYKKRYKVKTSEFKWIVLKSIVYNQRLPLKYRLKAQDLLSKFPNNCYFTRIRNRCIVTGRGRGVYSKYKLSRIKLREFSVNGLLPGVRKSSW